MIIRERDKKAIRKSIEDNEDRIRWIRNEIDDLKAKCLGERTI